MIGAGIAGLTAARALQHGGLHVTVFEKSSGPGGRAATRVAALDLSFDHGAQYFTARDPRFTAEVKAWRRNGVVDEWHAQFVEIRQGTVRAKRDQPQRYVGVPDMSALGRDLADGLHVMTDTRIVGIDGTPSGWTLVESDGRIHSSFSSVIVALPAPQAAELLGPHAFPKEALAIRMTPCWAVMAAFESAVAVEWDGAFVHGCPLAWVARNSSKPGRDHRLDAWVLHATADWSTTNLNASWESVATSLLGEFGRVTSSIVTPVVLDAKRWLYAAHQEPVRLAALGNGWQGLVVCGDWLLGGRIEGAYLSGLEAADMTLRGRSSPGKIA